MSSFLTFEGTSDYLAATPALIITLTASGSIAAGVPVAYETNTNAAVYQPAAIATGSINPAGVALSTVTTGQAVPVLVFGYAKSLPQLGTAALTPGYALVASGSGTWTQSAGGGSQSAGRIVSGSSGYIYALISCMKL
jgi:hypothetical protein